MKGRRMIITHCAACAAPLPPVSAKQCSRCKTRYCGPACQAQHWKEGGHDKVCKKIKRGGGAEQSHAAQKYQEAVAETVKACADDTKGQTCYICTEAVHWKTKEGLVRGCSCRGTSGFAHVSCLAEQAKVLVDEAEENNLDVEPKWKLWNTCGLYEQNYHGVLFGALAWACWKTYVGRPETNLFRINSMHLLGTGLTDAKHFLDALSVQEAELSLLWRIGTTEENVLSAQGNLAITYRMLERHESALRMRRDVYAGHLKLTGDENLQTLGAAYNYAVSLRQSNRYKEVKALMRKTMPLARRVLGESHELTLRMRKSYAIALHEDAGATLGDLREAVTTLEDTDRIARRVLGTAHPNVEELDISLRDARAALIAREFGAA